SGMDHYRTAIDRAGPDIPADILMQISGGLGKAGHLKELLALVEPAFNPSQHGLPVGNNLIKANLEVGQIDRAREILEALYGLQRPDWREPLSYWDTQIAETRLK